MIFPLPENEISISSANETFKRWKKKKKKKNEFTKKKRLKKWNKNGQRNRVNDNITACHHACHYMIIYCIFTAYSGTVSSSIKCRNYNDNYYTFHWNQWCDSWGRGDFYTDNEKGGGRKGGRKEGRRRKEEIYIRIHVLIPKCLESSVPVFLSLIKGHSSMAKFHIVTRPRFFHGPRIFSVLDFDRRKKKYNFCIFTFL